MSARDEGSALVEVLVAFVILSVTVIMGFQIFSDGLMRIGRTTAALELARDAEALLAAGEAQDSRFVVSRTPLAIAADTWVEVKPLRVRIWERGREDQPPLVDTVIIAPEPRP